MVVNWEYVQIIWSHLLTAFIAFSPLVLLPIGVVCIVNVLRGVFK